MVLYRWPTKILNVLVRQRVPRPGLHWWNSLRQRQFAMTLVELAHVRLVQARLLATESSSVVVSCRVPYPGLHW